MWIDLFYQSFQDKMAVNHLEFYALMNINVSHIEINFASREK